MSLKTISLRLKNFLYRAGILRHRQSMTATVIEFSEMKTFRSFSWRGQIFDECSTVPFRRAAVNPDPEEFEEISAGEMKSARGTKANYLGKVTQNGVTVEEWGWL